MFISIWESYFYVISQTFFYQFLRENTKLLSIYCFLFWGDQQSCYISHFSWLNKCCLRTLGNILYWFNKQYCYRNVFLFKIRFRWFQRSCIMNDCEYKSKEVCHYTPASINIALPWATSLRPNATEGILRNKAYELLWWNAISITLSCAKNCVNPYLSTLVIVAYVKCH